MRTFEVPQGARVADGFNGHVDADECPCPGPYQLTGLTRREDYGVVVAKSEDQAILDGQERNEDVFWAIALNPNGLKRLEVQT